jgi:hypothetical protein
LWSTPSKLCWIPIVARNFALILHRLGYSLHP